MWIWITVCCVLLSTWRPSFSISYNADFLWQVLFFLCIWKSLTFYFIFEKWSRLIFFCWLFFSPHFKYVIPLPLPSIISYKKSAFNLVCVCVCWVRGCAFFVMCWFSPAAFEIFLYFGFQHFCYDMLSVWISLYWSYLEFVELLRRID